MQHILAAESLFTFLLAYSMQTPLYNACVFDANSTESYRTKEEPIDLYSVFNNLTDFFSCNIVCDDGLRVSCNNVDIRNVSRYLPMQTKSLLISNSYFPIFRESLFLHLNNLEQLTLTNNSHHFVTSNAFKGLDNLKQLNLSQNNIAALKSALIPTPKLEMIDFSSNNVMNLKSIINATSHLKNLTIIRLNHNVQLDRIYYYDFLPLNDSKLMKLELSNTTISFVEKSAFQHLHRLKVLLLAANYLTEAALFNVTCGLVYTEIQELDLRLLVGLQDFPITALGPLTNTTIEKLDMSLNPVKRVPKFPFIPSLKNLRLYSCDIRSFEKDAFVNLSNLTHLTLNGNKIYFIDKVVVPMKQLQLLRVGNQAVPVDFVGIFKIFDFAFSEANELEVLSFESTNLGGSIWRHTFFGLRNLKTLYLSKTQTMLVEDYAFETLSSLNELQLHANTIKYLTNYTLYGLGNLTVLTLFYNQLYFAEHTTPLQNTPLLHILLLHRNKIEHIPGNTFSEMHELKFLSLSENGLAPWRQSIFSKQTNLTAFVISKNQLTHTTPAMMEDFYRVTQYLDVTDNPFNCSSCDMEDFRAFMNESLVTFWYSPSGKNAGSYACMNPPELRGQPLLQANVSTAHCSEVLHLEKISLPILLCAIMIFVFLSLWITYYFRWYFRYAVFHCCAVFKERRSSSDDSRHYTYDAFVSYNSADAPWVTSYLIPELEKTERFQLCIHDRNFIAGRFITENIMDSIDESRKVILVLSENFVKSEWCMYELHMAQHRLFDEKRDVLVLVKLTHIDKKLYTRNLSYLEKTRPCYLWTNDPIGQRLFWDKLRKNLNSFPSTQNTHLTKV